jgi:hypothetical protein
VQAVVLRRRGAQASPTGADVRVVTRLLGPDMHTASGTVMLNRVERLALRQGTLMMALYDGAHPTKPVSVPLVDVEKRLVRTPTVPSMP